MILILIVKLFFFSFWMDVWECSPLKLASAGCAHIKDWCEPPATWVAHRCQKSGTACSCILSHLFLPLLFADQYNINKFYCEQTNKVMRFPQCTLCNTHMWMFLIRIAGGDRVEILILVRAARVDFILCWTFTKFALGTVFTKIKKASHAPCWRCLENGVSIAFPKVCALGDRGRVTAQADVITHAVCRHSGT